MAKTDSIQSIQVPVTRYTDPAQRSLVKLIDGLSPEPDAKTSLKEIDAFVAAHAQTDSDPQTQIPLSDLAALRSVTAGYAREIDGVQSNGSVSPTSPGAPGAVHPDWTESTTGSASATPFCLVPPDPAPQAPPPMPQRLGRVDRMSPVDFADALRLAGLNPRIEGSRVYVQLDPSSNFRWLVKPGTCSNSGTPDLGVWRFCRSSSGWREAAPDGTRACASGLVEENPTPKELREKVLHLVDFARPTNQIVSYDLSSR